MPKKCLTVSLALPAVPFSGPPLLLAFFVHSTAHFWPKFVRADAANSSDENERPFPCRGLKINTWAKSKQRFCPNIPSTNTFFSSRHLHIDFGRFYLSLLPKDQPNRLLPIFNQIYDSFVAFQMQQPDALADPRFVTKSASIDALIDRIHTLARSMHELGQSVNNHVQTIGTRGEQTVARFDSNFGTITTDVERLFGQANQRMAEVPVGLLVAAGVAFGIALVLGLAWLGGLVAERALDVQRRRRQNEGLIY